MPEAKRTLIIEVDAGDAPLRGIVRDETGEERPFAGWLGFASALGQALDVDLDERDRAAATEASGEAP
jgi:hypothetical protein